MQVKFYTDLILKSFYAERTGIISMALLSSIIEAALKNDNQSEAVLQEYSSCNLKGIEIAIEIVGIANSSLGVNYREFIDYWRSKVGTFDSL